MVCIAQDLMYDELPDRSPWSVLQVTFFGWHIAHAVFSNGL